MISFKKYLLLKESMTFAVYDPDPESKLNLIRKQPHSIGDAADVLSRKVWKFMFENLSKEEQKEIADHNIPYTIQIDGFDFNKKNGVLNFYIAGFKDDFLKKVLSMVKYYMGDYGIRITGELRREKSGMFDSEVIRIPVEIENASDRKPPHVQLSNLNAHTLLINVLGYDKETIESGILNARDLLLKIEDALEDEDKLRLGTREQERDGNIIIGGYSMENVRERLEQLSNLCQWTIDNDYSEISVG